MIFYSLRELQEIQDNLKTGKRRFTVKTDDGMERDCIFTGSDLLIDRNNHSKSSGLVFDPKTQEFLWNYPHIGNIDKIAEGDNGFVETKYNGTMLAFLRRATGIVYRTRGMIEPESFYNDINRTIVEDEQTIVGIKPEVFQEFLKKYKVIFDEGRATGAITETGDIALRAIATRIKDEVAYLFAERPRVVGVFGEFVTRYNPIAVDANVTKGVHLDVNYQYVIFDILVKTDNGIEFVPYNGLQVLVLNTPLTKLVEGFSLNTENNEKLLEEIMNSGEEGIVVKTNLTYSKLKLAEVLQWERMVGSVGSVLEFSVKHVFEQGIEITDKDLFQDKILSYPDGLKEIYSTVWREISAQGVTMENMVDTFASRKNCPNRDAATRQINEIIEHETYLRLCPIIAERIVASQNIPLSRTYLEIPKYLYFHENPLYFNERRQKMLGQPWYLSLLKFLFKKQSWA